VLGVEQMILTERKHFRLERYLRKPKKTEEKYVI